MKKTLLLQVNGDVDNDVPVEEARQRVLAAFDSILDPVEPLSIKLLMIPEGEACFGVALQLTAHTDADLSVEQRHLLTELNESVSQNFGRIWEYCFAGGEVEDVVKRLKTFASWMGTAATMIPDPEK